MKEEEKKEIFDDCMDESFRGLVKRIVEEGVQESQAYFKENFLIKPVFDDDKNDAAAILKKRKEKKMGKKVEEVDPWANKTTVYLPEEV